MIPAKLPDSPQKHRRNCPQSEIPMYRPIALVTCITAALCGLPGCEKKEKILDVETPAGEIEIRKSDDEIEIEVESEDKTKRTLEIDIPRKTDDSP
jgi:hypothetical protein